jgi:hypothetical protein
MRESTTANRAVAASPAATPNPRFAGPFVGSPLRIVNSFSAADLKDLSSGAVLGVKQPGYLSKDVCRHAAARVAENTRMANYEVEKVKRHGVSFMDVAMNPALAQKYFDDSREAMKDLRRTFLPYVSVIDQLQAQIDETWPAGARIMTFSVNGTLCKLKRGTCREFPEGQKIDAHHDNFSFDASQFSGAPTINLQFSFNVYLQVADGGELVVYPRRIQTPQEESSLRDPGSAYGLRADLLGTPLEIRPAEGDLIIFCANQGHTVKPSFGGSRVTASLFAGLVDENEPLLLFN